MIRAVILNIYRVFDPAKSKPETYVETINKDQYPGTKFKFVRKTTQGYIDNGQTRDSNGWGDVISGDCLLQKITDVTKDEFIQSLEKQVVTM